jgi:outer membrane immunogenic protein
VITLRFGGDDTPSGIIGALGEQKYSRRERACVNRVCCACICRGSGGEGAGLYEGADRRAVHLGAGAYIGASVGGIWGNDQITDLDNLSGPGAAQTYSLKSAGVIGGGVLGYNWQFGQGVFGVEADLGGIGWSKTIWEPGAVGVTSNHLGSGFSGDVTARLGFAAGKGLFYAKGGWAFFDGTASVSNFGPAGLGTATTGNFTGGWTVGAGIEYAFANCWSAKVEYQHFDFGSQTANLFLTPANANFRYPNDLTADAVKIGVNYHFH